MQEYRIEYRAEAKKALESIVCRHLELVGVNSAERIKAKIEHSISLLKTSPYIGKETDFYITESIVLRKIVCAKFYICIYTIENDTIIVYYIFDGRTDYTKKLIRMLRSGDFET